MKAFVTGGTGFIGSHLVDFLLDSDKYQEVRCLIRSSPKWLEDKGINRISGNLHDLDALKRGIDGTDVIFHLAGLVKAKAWRDIKRVNVDATENIIQVARKKGVSNIVILSSLAAAGPSNGTPVKESDPGSPVSRYGESKKMMEERVRQISDDDISITILRPAAVYGPRDEDIFTIFKMANRGIFPIIGDGKRPRISMIYVKDVVQSIELARRHASPGCELYNIADSEIYTWDRVREVMSDALGKSTMAIRIKPHWVKKIAGVIEKGAALMGTYPILNRDKANELVLEWTCSIEKAKDKLGFHPTTSLDEGFTRTIHWYKLHHWL